jgi:L-lactate dehydrogenase
MSRFCILVGAGFVGSTTAFAVMMSGMAAEIVVIGRNSRRAEGQVNDLGDAEVVPHTTRIFVDDFSDCRSADVAIITAGVSQSGQESRVEGLRETGVVLHGIVNDVCLENPCGILLIASNPVDVLTYAAWKWSGLPAGRVIGSGTSLDTSRFRRRVAEHFGIASPTCTPTSSENMVTAKFLSCHRLKWRDFLSLNSQKK